MQSASVRVVRMFMMRAPFQAQPIAVSLLLAGTLLAYAPGCTRTKYRLAADREVYDVIAERNFDPRWAATDYSIDIDPRSRYFDPYDPDRPPMPPDDPQLHQYMEVVDGKKGWKHWNDFGERLELENPTWREALGQYVELNEKGEIKLDVDTALKLAYVHSPSHQNQLETLYLSALDVTTERFRLDTQFFGGYDARFAHNGSLIPPALRFDPTLGRFVVNPPIDGAGVENNRLTLGRPTAAAPALQATRRFANAGEMLVGFANSFVFEFTGHDQNLAASLANFSLVQPLLRGAGKDIALEQLTIVERALLANIRAYHNYRQGFFTQVAIGDLGVAGPQRRGGFFGGTGLTGFTGQGAGGFGGVGGSFFGGGGFGGGGGNGGTGTGFAGGGAGTVGGFIGLLQQLQQIRNTEDSLSLQLRNLSLLESLLDAGVIDLVQIDQFRQSIETERATLLQNRNGFQVSLEGFKTGVLGLPPDLPMDLDDSMIRQFQLVAREATAVQDSITKLQDRVGNLEDDPPVEEIVSLLGYAYELIEPIRRQLDDVQADLELMEKAVPAREKTLTDTERKLFERDRKKLHTKLAELTEQFGSADAALDRLRSGLSAQTKRASIRGLVNWLSGALTLVQESILVQAGARLEAVTVQEIDLKSDEAFRIALANRVDFMNSRAALVDSWRLIQFNADALQSVLNVTASGDLRTAKNNAASFRAPTGNLRLGLQFDAPITRLLERNNYRQSLIDYQRSRRRFIQSRDSLHLGLRALLRQIEQLRTNLEIQRRAVSIAIRRVDLTRAGLFAPVPPPLPGQPPARFGETAVTNLLTALSDLRNTQNNFMSVWLNYYAARMRLHRELGIMALEPDGSWIDYPISSATNELGERDMQLPPSVPQEWVDLSETLSEYEEQAGPALQAPAGSARP